MNRIFLVFATFFLLMDAARAETASADWNSQLQKAASGATRLRVRSGGVCHRDPKQEKTLFDSNKPKEIEEFVQGIKINESESGFHCMCCGEPTIEIYKGGELAVVLGYHHGRSLRWADGPWSGDGLLTEQSSDFMISWLAEHGVAGPKEEMEESIREAEKSRKSEEKWLAAMPKSLEPFWASAGDPFAQSQETEMAEALKKEFPEENARILVLLGWYGSGEGPWSGFPSYEEQAQKLLLMNGTKSILAAMESAELSEAQMEGAARLFGGGGFRRQRPDDMSLLGKDLKKRLLLQGLKSTDENKRERAKRAFED